MPVLVGEAHEQAGHGEDEGADGEDQGPVEVVGGHPHHQQRGGEGGNKGWTNKNLVRSLFIFIPNSSPTISLKLDRAYLQSRQRQYF